MVTLKNPLLRKQNNNNINAFNVSAETFVFGIYVFFHC